MAVARQRILDLMRVGHVFEIPVYLLAYLSDTRRSNARSSTPHSTQSASGSDLASYISALRVPRSHPTTHRG